MERFPTRHENGCWTVFTNKDGIVRTKDRADAEMIARAKREMHFGNDPSLCLQIAHVLDRYCTNSTCARLLRDQASQMVKSAVSSV